MNRRQTLTLGAVGLAAGAAGLGWALWRQPGPAAEPIPGFWALRFDRPEGGELSLASYRGQALVLNFWATWCPPCIKELPEFDRFHRERRAPSVAVVGLAVDGPTPVRQFLSKQPLGFGIGLAGFEGTELSKQLGNTQGSLPFTVTVDRGGQVRHRKLGTTTHEELLRWGAELSST